MKFIKNHKMFILVITATILMLIGLSYAWLQITLKGEKELKAGVGTLQLELSDTMTDGINVMNATPVTDEEGLATIGYSFTLENTGTIPSSYEIFLDDLPLTEGQNRMEDSFIKYQLVKDEQQVGFSLLNEIGENPKRLLDLGEIAPKTKYSYILKMWIDENATLEVMGTAFRGQLRVEATQSTNKKGNIEKVIFNKENIGQKGSIDTSDSEQVFITGENPKNYVWYSGKLWRAISYDKEDKSVKLVTQWNISSLPYNQSNNVQYEGSYMQAWLNDTSVDGFLGNLREPEKFIKTDSLWNVTETTEITKPEKTTMITNAVGTLNAYEYTKSYDGTTYSNGYLNNGLSFRLMNPYNSTNRVWFVNNDGSSSRYDPTYAYGVRPSINLKPGLEIITGDGSERNPYRLSGDNEKPDQGRLLNTRYSGEYVRFGTGENSLYRIVSKEFGGVKLVSAEPLKTNNSTLLKKFNTVSGNASYNPASEASEIAFFLHNTYLNPTNKYLTQKQIEMIIDTPWYLGAVGSGGNYKLAKYKDESSSTLTTDQIETKVGLLRLGEQLASQSQRHIVKGATEETGLTVNYWLITPFDNTKARSIIANGYAYSNDPTSEAAIRPCVNLIENIKIIRGSGTKKDPFEISE